MTTAIRHNVSVTSTTAPAVNAAANAPESWGTRSHGRFARTHPGQEPGSTVQPGAHEAHTPVALAGGRPREPLPPGRTVRRRRRSGSVRKPLDGVGNQLGHEEDDRVARLPLQAQGSEGRQGRDGDAGVAVDVGHDRLDPGPPGLVGDAHDDIEPVPGGPRRRRHPARRGRPPRRP
jgi:hypothetical protein